MPLLYSEPYRNHFLFRVKASVSLRPPSYIGSQLPPWPPLLLTPTLVTLSWPPACFVNTKHTVSRLLHVPPLRRMNGKVEI